MLKKLQMKFVLVNMTIVILMLIVIFGLVYGFTQRNLATESVSMMNAIATKPLQPGPPNDTAPEVKLPFIILHLGFDGELVLAEGAFYDLSDSEFLNELIDASMQNKNDIGVIKEHNLRFCRVKNPRGTVLVFSDISSERSTLNHLLQSFGMIGCISSLVFLGISILLAKWAVKPVAKAWQQQKQFVADASHELKTPLTVIMTNTELLQSTDYNELERKKFLQSISLMSGQMKQLVEKMLVLAKSDHREAPVSMETIDMSKLVLDTAISFEGVFVEKGLALESFVKPGILVHGNKENLQQVIDILLDNAQKYSSPDSTTRIELYHVDKKKCCLKVSNPGAPLSELELTNIFQRFYRADPARSRDGSFGLGLSIAESIVSIHKGKIWAASHNGINSFFVELRKKIS